MAIIKKVTRDLEEERLKIINGGGFSKADIEDSKQKEKKKEEGYKYHALRMPVKIMRQVDELKAKRAGITRTTWILEAIQEKIKRETK